MRTVLLSAALLAGVCLSVNAQIKIGGKTINTQKATEAVTSVAKAVTLTDDDIATISQEYIEWMDTNNPVLGTDTEKGARLARLVENVTEANGLPLNFKVYNVVDVNAFACGDGSIRVCGGLMDVMDDAEVMAVLGHEIGHVVNKDVKDAMKTAYMTSAARSAVGATGAVAEALTDSQLGDLAESFSGAQFSQKQENAADDYAFEFCIKNNIDPYGMSNALNKLVELYGGSSSSTVQKMFSSHPDSEKRAKRMKEKADKYTKK